MSTKVYGVKPENLNLGDGTYIAHGSLSNGACVSLRSDGKVEVTAGTDTVISSSVVFEADWAANMEACYVTDTEQVVVIYRSDSTDRFGYAVVGTVSAGVISFGTPVAFSNTEVVYLACCYDETLNKVIVAYSDVGNSNYGTAKEGTVSGTSISFGDAIVFAATSVADSALCYAPDSGKNILVYSDASDGWKGYANAGTGATFLATGTLMGSQALYFHHLCYDSAAQRVISTYVNNATSNYPMARRIFFDGSSVNTGSPLIIVSQSVTSIDCCYDSLSDRVVSVFTNASANGVGIACVFKISEFHVMTKGDPIVFVETHVGTKSVSYSPTANRIVIAYSDYLISGRGYTIIGKVEGYSLSLRDPVLFEAGATFTLDTLYLPGCDKVIVSYSDEGNAAKGTATLITPEDTNADGFIGISSADYVDGDSAIIYKLGSVANNLTGLTIGANYSVSVSGALSQSETPFTVIGTALSATELIITQKDKLEAVLRDISALIYTKTDKLILEKASAFNDYTLTNGDQTKIVVMEKATPGTLTIPPETIIYFSLGTVIHVYNKGAGTITPTQGDGVTIRNITAIPQYGEAKFRKRATAEWIQT